jgi:hypothetical protein
MDHPLHCQASESVLETNLFPDIDGLMRFVNVLVTSEMMITEISPDEKIKDFGC